MRTLISFTFYFALFVLLTSCSPQSSEIRASQVLPPPAKVALPQYSEIPAQKFQWIHEDGGQSQLSFNPRLDILFVSDNSDSMKDAQENLAQNIDRFAAAISRNKMIDYHIGVVSCWDSSERYLKTKKDSYQIGDLRFAKDSEGKTINQKFVSKWNRSRLSLSKSLDIGVTPYAEGGPEFEEFFSPINAALEKMGHGASNEGFFRDDAQLVVIIMTDADDSTARLSPEQMAKTLLDFKGGQQNKLAVYGVLVKSQDSDKNKDWDLRIHPKYHPECFDMTQKVPKNNGKCTGFGPERLEQFIVAANSNSGTPDQIRAKHIMSILSKNFGTDLGKIGDEITVKTLEKEIFLTQRPRVSDQGQLMVRVYYGTDKQLASGTAQVIAQKQNGGWVYDPDNNSVHLSGSIQYNYEEGAHFSVQLIPLTLKL